MEKTVGGKNLRREREQDKTKKAQKKPQKKPPVQHMTAVNVIKEESKDKKLDLLFYMDRRDTACIRRLREYSLAKGDLGNFYSGKGFLGHFQDFNWQVSFSYYTEYEARLMPLEFHNGITHNISKDFMSNKKAYVLSREDGHPTKKRNRLFYTTLEPTQFLGDTEKRGSSDFTPDSNRYDVHNPLSGLDYILSKKPAGSFRKGAKAVVLFFGDRFPYYSPEVWKHFYTKHKKVSIIALSPRTAQVANLMHVLEKSQYDFDYFPGCDIKRASGSVKLINIDKLIHLIRSKVK